MLIAEGLPPIILGVVLLIELNDRPQEAKWLSVEERLTVADAVAAETRDHSVKDFPSVLKDPRVLLLAAIQFGFTLGSYRHAGRRCCAATSRGASSG
jgi:ACS family tartrate transporter-like MFS transporter